MKKNFLFIISGLVIVVLLIYLLKIAPYGIIYKNNYDLINVYKTNENADYDNDSLVKVISNQKYLEQLHNIFNQSELFDNNIKKCNEDIFVINYVLETLTKNHVRLFSVALSKCTKDQAIIMFAPEHEKWGQTISPYYSVIASKEDTKVLMSIIEEK